MFGLGKRKQQPEHKAAPLAAPRTDWQSLPPIQRAVDAIQTVGDPHSFEAGLATRDYPGVISSMSHQVDNDGPRGTVVGVPVVEESAAPMQWRRSPTSNPSIATVQTSVESPRAEPQRAAPDVRFHETNAASETPQHREPVAQPLVADTPPVRTETVAQPDSDSARTESAPLLGHDAPITSLPLPLAAPANDASTTAPPVRRLGLGAPIASGPATRPVQRAAEGTPSAEPTRRRALASAPPIAPNVPNSPVDRPAGNRAIDPPTLGVTSAPKGTPGVVAAREVVGTSERPGASSDRLMATPATIQRVAASTTPAPAPRSAPLVGALPLTAVRSRAAVSSSTVTGTPSPALAAVGARADGGAAPSPQEFGYSEHVYGGEPFVQRQALAGTSPAVSSPARAQRAMAPASTTAAAAISSGLGTMGSDGAVVFRTPDDGPEPSAVATTSPSAPIQAVPTPAPAAPAAPAAASGALDTQQLDVLAQAVYGRVRDRIKAELRLDRERSGRLIELGRS